MKVPAGRILVTEPKLRLVSSPCRKRRQHELIQDCERRSPILWLVVVARGNDDDQVELRHNKEPLAAVSKRANPWCLPIAKAGTGEPPEIPIRGDNIGAFPSTTIQ